MKFLALSFIAGVIGACGFQPVGLWPLTIVAFAALLWLVETAPSLRSALARGWWFAVGHFALGLNWIATAFTFQAAMPAWLGWIAVVLLSLYLAVYPAMATGLAWKWGAAKVRPGDEPAPHGRSDRLRLVLLFAAAWIITEWLRATMFTGFAWNPEGVIWLDVPGVAGLSRFIGTYGLSAVAMLASGTLLLAAQRNWKPAAAIGLPILACAFLLVPAAAPPAKGIAIRVVQPNIGQENKWRDGFEEINFARHAQLSADKPVEPRLLFWPEAAVISPLEDGRRLRYAQLEAKFTRLSAASLLAPDELLLTGGVTYRSANGLNLTSATNSIFAIDATGRILGRYDKAHLVPYGEYLPARPLLSAIGLSRLAPGDIDFDSGPGPHTIDLPLAGKVGFQLCYEIIFSGQVVDRHDRPNFIFNPSNDAWFGAWGPPQHLAQARLRALEEGLPVIRATPTGISAVIDSRGRIVDSLPWRTAGAIDARLPPPDAPTLFARYGNLVPFALALLLIGVAVVPLRRYGRI